MKFKLTLKKPLDGFPKTTEWYLWGTVQMATKDVVIVTPTDVDNISAIEAVED